MTISQAITIVLLIAVFASTSGIDLANNTVLLIILFIALIALSGVTTLANQSNTCRNRVISDLGTITQTLF